MKPTTILLGLSLITNANSQSLTRDLPIKTELLENGTFDNKLMITENFKGLSSYENAWLTQNYKSPITVPNAEACQQIFASAAAACTYMAWNPFVYAACMAAASAAFAACMAAS